MMIENEKRPLTLLDNAIKMQKREVLNREDTAEKKEEAVKEDLDKKYKKVWTRPVMPESVANPVRYANRVANEELLKALAPLNKVSTHSDIELRLTPDPRNSPRGDFWARILDQEGYTLAEVWGTKKGKARTYRIDPGREIEPSEEQRISVALPIARRFVTNNPEAAHADDSAPESGSDTSDDEL